MRTFTCLAVFACVGAVMLGAGCSSSQAAPSGVTSIDEHTVYGQRNFLTGYESTNADGTHNMVVEIPTGTSEKWEICTSHALTEPEKFPGCTVAGRELVHEVKDGVRRIVTHIGYPGNYGSLPKTRAGDGDPLDVIAIGPAAERGSVIPVRVVGVIRCMDGEDQDDKVVAITGESPLFAQVASAADLESKAPRAADILFSWFMGYKGNDEMACSPMSDETVAAALIAEAASAFVAR